MDLNIITKDDKFTYAIKKSIANIFRNRNTSKAEASQYREAKASAAFEP